MKYFKKLRGERIYLSPRSIEDAEQYTEWMNDFDTTDYIGTSFKVMSLQDEQQYLETNKKAEVAFAIVTEKEDKLIGCVALHDIDNIRRIATMGIFIGDREYRGQGYGTEAVKLILDFGFNYLNLNNIKLDLKEFNERALACYKKCGFKEYGRRRKCNFINGKYYDSIEMDILAEEFKESYIKNKNI